MDYEWNAAKNAANQAKHGVAFEAVETFDWNGALVKEDERHAYGETRLTAVGCIGTRLYVLVFTARGAAVRVISLRKANKREQKTYGEN